MPDIKTDDGCVIHVEVEGPSNGPVLMLSNSLGNCIDIVTQLSPVRAALRRAEEAILADHVAHCVEQAIHGAN